MDTKKSKTVVGKRPARKPIHTRSILESSKRKGFVRRFVNEEAGRIQMFIEAGWTPVEGIEDASNSRAQDATQQSSIVRRVVNRGTDARSHTAILMEIPEDLYNEDQAEKQKKVNAIEASYDPKVQNQPGADYGEMEKKYT